MILLISVLYLKLQTTVFVLNCIEKFQLPHSNFAVMLNGAPVDVNLSLADAGLSDSCQIDLVPLE